MLKNTGTYYGMSVPVSFRLRPTFLRNHLLWSYLLPFPEVNFLGTPLWNGIVDPDPHSFALLDPERPLECGPNYGGMRHLELYLTVFKFVRKCWIRISLNKCWFEPLQLLNLNLYRLQLLNFRCDADPDPGLYSNADPDLDPAFQNNAAQDPDRQTCLKSSWKL